MTLQDYILQRSAPTESGCREWLLSVGSHGYGNAFWQGRSINAHRLSYKAFHGPIPAGMLVQHSCDNRRCVLPDHLSLGTDATNAEDKAKKGRASRKLTADAVAAMRARRAAGDAIRAIARDFDVNQRLVQKIVRRAIWRHVA